MPVIDDKPLARICVRIFQEDYDYVRLMASARSGSVSANEIIRTILHNYVTQLRANERERIDQLPVHKSPTSIEIEL